MGRLHIRRRPRLPDPTTELAGQGARLTDGKDLVAGSGIAFADHGVQELKGVPGEWRMYAVTNP
jgi:hypothetical protein